TIIKGIPPFGALYLLAVLLFFYLAPRHIITWLSVPFILVHTLIAHKEFRFLYPLLPFIPYILAHVWEYAAERWRFSSFRGTKVFTTLFHWHNALLVIFVLFWGIVPDMSLYRSIYRQYQQPINLYCLNDNPYRLALEVEYYKPAGLRVRQMNSLNELPQYGDTYLLAVDKRKAGDTPLPSHHRLVYSSYPVWIYYFNVGGWLKRSQWWLIYECTPDAGSIGDLLSSDTSG
ncbi:MAG: hypothetical protein R2795_19930, partial [Saprospiraceae bacterium]